MKHMSKAWAFRLKAALLHACFSALMAGLAAALVFGMWHPPPYSKLSGGVHLFVMLVGIDVVLGPLLTMVIAQVEKRRRELALDLSFIVLIQLAALGYGVYTMALARPVVVALEGERLRLVSATQVRLEEMDQAPEGLRRLSWRGPIWVDTRPPRDEEERFAAITMAMGGYDVGARPSFWREWDRQSALRAMAQPCELLGKAPGAALMSPLGSSSPWQGDVSVACPVLIARQGEWRMLLRRPDGHVLGVLPEPQ